ncbi:MAG: DUF962 domain-containing protein [Flavobacteriales bacterium]|nr:DUF962 domain-containing protein [Flavobacteriales bacterium]
MRKLDTWLDEYGESHKNPTNKAVHWICVPAIFFSIVGLFWSIPFPFDFVVMGQPLNWAFVATGLVFIYYLTLSFSLSIGLFLFTALCLVGNSYLAALDIMPLWAISLIIFAVAWVGQFWGHKVEGKKPSFFKDLQFLMIGPAWLMHFIYKKIGIPY